jgi:hypothetical protein
MIPFFFRGGQSLESELSQSGGQTPWPQAQRGSAGSPRSTTNCIDAVYNKGLTAFPDILNFSASMSDNLNLPGGALPPKKETGKVQPKKETVRINLPPKPAAAPTIKLPTLPPGGPVAAAASTAAPVAAPAAAPKATLSGAAAPRATGVPTAVPGQKPGAAPKAAAPKPKPALSGLDLGLGIAAAVAALAAVGSTLYLMLAVIN